MDETEGDSRYLSNYGVNQGYRSSRPKFYGRSLPHPYSHQIAENYVSESEDEDEDEKEEQEVDTCDDDNDSEMNGVIQQNGDDVENEEDDTDGGGDGEIHSTIDSFNLHRHPKKKKLKSLLYSFDFAPRVLALAPPLVTSKHLFGQRNTLTNWSEHETFVLLDAWSERFLQLRRKNLKSEEWQEVAKKVSKESKRERTDTQCRNRMDTLKKKYKKEKDLLKGIRGANTKWVYFKKMDMLMSSTPYQRRLSCGVDSGEYLFINSTVYLDHENGLDSMRDSPSNTDSQKGNDDFNLLLTKMSNSKQDSCNGGSFRLLANSINKFTKIYEKIENGKRKQMVELNKMIIDFYKELEIQKRQIFNKARDEIAKIRQGDYEENDSAKNING